MKNFLNEIRIKRFDSNLEKCRKKALKLYDEKQNTVVCKYCGQLLLKNEAGCVYNIRNQTLEFFMKTVLRKTNILEQR